ncbi:MAG: restriction endonuclease S subunit/very-short-patch-repair endonuclease [Sediminicola sp.]|jgi:restriction endonuclease S subunit/very-short-patch-repair endonuclease
MPSNSTQPLSSLQGGVPALGGGGGLLEHFKDLTLHPKNAEELKGLILQLAIQGKLTAQWRRDNPDAEPASVLLKRIATEKAMLVKEKKIKKEKPLPNVEKEEAPNALPVSWSWCRLQDLEYILGDGIHGTPDYTINGEYHFINGNNLSDGVIEIKSNTKTVSKEEYLKHKRNLNDRTVLVSINGTIGNTAFYGGEKVMLGKSACYFNLFEDVDKEYIRQLIKTEYFRKYAFSSASGTTIKNVSLRTMRSFIVPLPPLEEQKAIVATVNQLFAEVEQLEDLTKQRIQTKEDFVTSALRELSTEDTNNAWAFLQPHFKSFFTEKSSVKKLRESILQLAVQGKLTKHWRSTKQLLPRKGEVPQAEGSNPALKPEVPQAEGSNPALVQEVPQGSNPALKPKVPLSKETQIQNIQELNSSYRTKDVLNNLPHLKTFRKELRNNLTPAEASLWKMLKGKQLDHRKFRRQHSVANYILDFYCPEEKLAIELDGDGHYEERQMEYDHERDLFLNHFGIKVLRFENKWVWQNTAGVLQAIRDAFGWLEKQPPRPPKADTPPLKGGEWIEHASVLLERIKAEKEALIKAKTIKKEKPFPSVTLEEEPFVLPEGWAWSRFQEIFDIRDGTHDSPKDAVGSNTYPLITSKNFKGDKIDFESSRRISEEDYNKVIQRSQVHTGDMLFSMIGGNIGNQVEVGDITEFAIKNVALFKYYKYGLPAPGFLKMFSQFIAMSLQSEAAGGAQPFVSLKFFRNLIVGLPSLEEQKAIVQKVNALMALCDTLEKEIETHQTTQEHWMQSCLKEVFEISK